MASEERIDRENQNRDIRTRISCRRIAFAVAYGMIVLTQCAFAIHGIDNFWQKGHNGYNGAAYHQAARNSLRFGYIFPDQYSCDYKKREPNKSLYTHAPLGLHAHVTLSVWLFGDSVRSVRLVPALYGILATIALLAVVRRHWGDLFALVAGAIYVLLPINHSFANMVNHSTGFIFWSLIALACYLKWAQTAEIETPGSRRPRTGLFRSDCRWLAAVFAASLMAMFWDWPAYYVMFAIAIHWLYLSYDAAHGKLRHFRGLNREHLALTLFCLFVLANFVGFFFWVRSALGNFDDVLASINMRTYPMAGDTQKVWTNTLKPAFSPLLIAMGLLWVFGFVVRHARNQARHRDLIPLAFFFAGCLHLLLFKRTAVIHIYWPWPLNPFIAIASASVLFWLSKHIESFLLHLAPNVLRRKNTPRLSTSVAFISVLVVLIPFSKCYLKHTVPLIELGRRYAGVFEFANYDADYELIFFFDQVRMQTTRDTGVAIHKSLQFSIQESATLDRFALKTQRLWPPKKSRDSMPGGWVETGSFNKTDFKELIDIVSQYPYRQYGLYYMIDYRRERKEIRIYDLVSKRPDLMWKILANAFIPPLQAVRNPIKEVRFAQTVDGEKI
ncbi:MAG: glycosyltransferase family 39 protein [Deltaproteobacteria bacterium]|nr:glycosyltransferase family 39 protein [Deltaproteobacteria bacterium]